MVGIMPVMHNSRGVILITTVMILSFLSVLGLSLISYILSRNQKVQIELDRLKALYLAEAGIAKSVYELRKDQDFDGDGVGNIRKASFGGGRLRALHNFQTSTVTAWGEYNDIERVIQIKYSAL